MRFLFLSVESSYLSDTISPLYRGLDNAGKTTIMKRINGEDIKSISPTLGFNIKTFVHRGYTLNVCERHGYVEIA